MQIAVRGHGVGMTDALKEYATKKIEKLEHFYSHVIRTEIELEVKAIKDHTRNHVCKVTMWLKEQTLRAEEAMSDMYAAIDMVFDNLEIQLVKYKEKHIQEKRRQGHILKEKMIEKERE